VLIVDEAQEMPPAVLAKLRLLSSARLDSHILLTVVLAGDGRLLERLRSEELRVRLALERTGRRGRSVRYGRERAAQTAGPRCRAPEPRPAHTLLLCGAVATLPRRDALHQSHFRAMRLAPVCSQSSNR
jgi:hypothetical protein